MITKRNALFVLLNFLGIAVNATISFLYYLSVDDKTETIPELFLINIFLLLGSILFTFFWTRDKKRIVVLYFMFVLICCGLIFCVIDSIIKNSLAERFCGLIGCVYFFLNLLYGIFCKRVRAELKNEE